MSKQGTTGEYLVNARQYKSMPNNIRIYLTTEVEIVSEAGKELPSRFGDQQ